MWDIDNDYTLDLDDDGSTCIGLEGKMLRVGGLIPDDEFSAEKHTCTKFININLCVNIFKQVNIDIKVRKS